jgi:hypothetical protein
MDDYFKHEELMKSPPIKRAAYSDRTAWIMAELSRLVYEHLPSEKELEEFLDRLSKQILEGVEKSDLKSTASRVLTTLKGESAESDVSKVLASKKIKLIKSYSEEGTEAMIVEFPQNKEAGFDGMFVIVFRGTQINSIKDIKSDLKADLVPAKGGGRIHRGFKAAYEKIDKLLSEDLKQAGTTPVYITGHSLGGALAMVATRYLCNDSLGATYTFGCPRVADDDFFKCIKTPVYRVVNAADGVARVPFGSGLTLFLIIIRLIPINGTKVISEFFRKYFSGYTHYGNMTLLSAGAAGSKVQIYKSPTIFKAALQVILPHWIKTRGKATFTDHFIAGYCKKLGDYALERFNI